MIKLNDIPVRTSRNFRINNIKFDDVVLPEWRTAFDGGSFRLGDVHEKSSLKEDEKINKQWTYPSISF